MQQTNSSARAKEMPPKFPRGRIQKVLKLQIGASAGGEAAAAEDEAATMMATMVAAMLMVGRQLMQMARQSMER